MKKLMIILVISMMIIPALLTAQDDVNKKVEELEETVKQKNEELDEKVGTFEDDAKADKKSDDFKQHTLFKTGKVSHGGFGGPTIKVSAIKNVGRVLVGGRGGWIINHCFSIGGGGYGVATPITGNVNGTNKRYHMGYGGLELGFTIGSASLVHLNFLTLIGAGGIGYGDRSTWHPHDRDDDHDDMNFNGDGFFVVEPMAYLELNMTKWFRVCLGGGYRYVDGLNDVPNFSNQDLCGPSVELMLKFGRF